MANNLPVTKFFDTDYIAFGSYDGVRKIASYIDGLKPTARKVIFTVMDLNIKEPKKVDSLKAKAADHTEYIHGQDSFEGVIVNLAQDFVGAQNLPLMTREGSFGTRMIPQAAASRYIRSAQEDYLKLIFRPDDNAVIGNQEFEGSIIEPKYYVPIIPMLLVNGSDGIAVGYAQRILPRDPAKLMKFIFGGMKDEKLLLPWFKGFKGKVIQTDDKSFSIYGVLERKNTTTYEIVEVPIGYTYNSYMKVLQSLQDSNDIQSFDDLCDMDKDVFKFVIKVRRETDSKLTKMSHEEQLEYFKLVKRVTENYTCLNENNQIEVFDSAADIVKKYAKVRVEAYSTRKQIVEKQMLDKIYQLKSKIMFIHYVREGEIDIKNSTKQELIDKLHSMVDILAVKNSFDYLLNIPIWSISQEAQEKAKDELKKLAEEYKAYCELKISTLWKKEHEELCKKLK